jgi:hypothetical protein
MALAVEWPQHDVTMEGPVRNCINDILPEINDHSLFRENRNPNDNMVAVLP